MQIKFRGQVPDLIFKDKEFSNWAQYYYFLDAKSRPV